MSAEHEEYWYCVRHHRVETVENICPSRHRLGPYPSFAEAERALEKTQERNEAWDNDPAWNDDAPEGSADDPLPEG